MNQSTPPEVQTLPNFYWTIDHYHEAIEKGVLNPNHKCELLHGKLVARPRITPLRAATRSKLSALFIRRFSEQEVSISPAGVLTLPNDCEPEPDLVVHKLDDYPHHPYAEDTLLVIEVSDENTVARDRTVMLSTYAGSGIEEYWIINVSKSTLARHTDPHPVDNEYGNTEIYHRGDSFTSLYLGEFAVNHLLP